MAEIYKTISIIAFSLCGLFLVLAIFLWFRYKIHKIISDLTGRTAKKAIAQIRTETGKSGNKVVASVAAPNKFYAARGNVSGSLVQKKAKKPETGLLGRDSGRLFELKTKDKRHKSEKIYYTEPVGPQAEAKNNSQTVVLTPPQESDKNGAADSYTGSERTEVLTNKAFLQAKPLDQTEILAGFSQATMVLAGGQPAAPMPDDTQLLPTALPSEPQPSQPKRAQFDLVETITMVHTEEVIT